MSISGKPNEVKLLLGNEAVARGALEGGIRVASGYPGTPSTEIIESLAEVANEYNLYVEWSVNEKVALETAFSASLSGLRAITVMKHVGLNVAADTLMSIGYSGVGAGLIIVSADDPNCYSSQNEQDNRWYGVHGYIPVYEPASPQEAKDMTKDLLDISEKYHIPILLRLTTRISHTCGPVKLGEIKKVNKEINYTKERERFVLLPINARRRKQEVLLLLKNLEKDNEKFKYNDIYGNGEVLGIIACGNAFNYAIEAVNILNISDKVTILKLTSLYPLPKDLIVKFINTFDKVLIVEEVDPFVELMVRKIANEENINVKIYGKNLMLPQGELTTDKVVLLLAKILNLKFKIYNNFKREVKIKVPPRPPTFCPGCPHRASFYVLKQACIKAGLDLKKEVVFAGDIGCYTLGYFKPFELIDTTICMGASIGMAQALAKFGKYKLVVAIIGDSTFYHTGIPALINGFYNYAPFLTYILDNNVTAMTGFQPHPGTGYNAIGEKANRVMIENLVKSIGIKSVYIIDPYNVEESIKVLLEAIKKVIEEKELVVVISRRECALLSLRRRGVKRIYKVDQNLCKKCLVCINTFACPAISFDGEKVTIRRELCVGCGVCAKICPYGAIKKEVIEQ